MTKSNQWVRQIQAIVGAPTDGVPGPITLAAVEALWNQVRHMNADALGQSASTPLAIAGRLLGISERSGGKTHPFIEWSHEIARMGTDVADEVPWCSSFVNAVCLLAGVQNSGSAMARSWLSVGSAVPLGEAAPGYDVCVFTRAGHSVSARVLNAPGHVGFYLSRDDTRVLVRGGNQSNRVSDAWYPQDDLIQVRRLPALKAIA